MVFSSYVFVLAFLPTVLLLTVAARRWFGIQATMALLTLSSLVFYAYWDWRFVWVIVLSIGVNYIVGVLLSKQQQVARRRVILTVGILFNLSLLGFFKYTNFFVENVGSLFGGGLSIISVTLPLGVSFFTFQQIAYLVDVHRRQAVEHDFVHYALFVSFFPQLIAGPIVHHMETMPQFVSGNAGRFVPSMFAQGLAVFTIGLVKKVLIADYIAQFATPVFDAAATGVGIPLLEAWGGLVAYSFQIYFDFSAYSDMAIGLGLMFGVRLPINFRSPYKADNLIQFWRCWHITLSSFLRDYLYFPLGGNRLGNFRRYQNLLIVMVLGGLWHGAGWTFVIWGAIHGIGLTINHLWQQARRPRTGCHWLANWASVALTFLFVTVAWTFFRASDLSTAANILQGLVGGNGIVLPDTYYDYLGPLAPIFVDAGVTFAPGYLFQGISQILWLLGLLAMVWVLPTTLQWVAYDTDAHRQQTVNGKLASIIMWRPTVAWSLVLSGTAISCLIYMSRTGEFLYFQF